MVRPAEADGAVNQQCQAGERAQDTRVEATPLQGFHSKTQFGKFAGPRFLIVCIAGAMLKTNATYTIGSNSRHRSRTETDKPP
jgi:hypothetical protein